MKNQKIYLFVITALLVINMVVTGVYVSKNNTQPTNGQIKYTLYIGTNDKDTYKQEIPLDECKQIVIDICTDYAGGCTLLDASGYWKDDTGTITSEQTIEVVLEDISEKKVHKIANKVIKKLNQNSILIETNNVQSEFYSGK